MSLEEYLEEKAAVEALPILVDAGVERPYDLDSLTKDDLRGLGLSQRLSRRLTGTGDELGEEVEEAAPPVPPVQPTLPRRVSTGSALSMWLTSNDLDAAEAPLTAMGIERVEDMRLMTAEDLKLLVLPEGLQHRLHAALHSTHVSGRWSRLNARLLSALADPSGVQPLSQPEAAQPPSSAALPPPSSVVVSSASPPAPPPPAPAPPQPAALPFEPSAEADTKALIARPRRRRWLPSWWPCC